MHGERCIRGVCKRADLYNDPSSKDGGVSVVPDETRPSDNSTRPPDQRTAPDTKPAPDRPGTPDNPSTPDTRPPADRSNPPPDRTTPPKSGSRFSAQATAFGVPSVSFCKVASSGYSKYWSVMDLDGDKKPDLVWTHEPGKNKAFTSGGAHWKIFKNDGSRFSSQASIWTIPSAAFDRVASAGYGKYWSVMDIDGDKKPDLVWTHEPGKNKAFTSGAAHWKVYKNTGSGFSNQASIWTIPSAAFDRVAASGYGKYWSVMDIDGDQKPDLVWTHEPGKNRAFSSGGAHWKVYKNTGSGFSNQASIWTIPTASFDRVASAGYGKYWSVMDLDGDKKPDFVWTHEPGKSKAFTSGGAHWKIYKNTGSGFSNQASVWTIPTASFDRVASAGYSKYWSVMDLDGDKKPDFVWTHEPGKNGAFTSGGAHWKVYKNTGSGFSSQAIAWKIPTRSFDRVAAAGYGKYWAVMDLNGDEKLDFVWTADSSKSPCSAFSSGGIHWKLFLNE